MQQVRREDALELLIRTHAAEVHRYLSRLTGGDRSLAEDLVQDVFVTLFRQSEGRDLGQLGLPWLLTVARSRFIDHVRSSAARARRETSDIARRTGNAMEADIDVVSAEAARWMLSQLPDDERWALALAVVDGMPVAELADVLGRSVGATHSLLARGRRRLRAIMEGEPR